MASFLFYLILALVTAGFLFGQLLALLNHRQRFKPVPAILNGVYSPERYSKYLEYKKVSYRFGLLMAWLSFGATLLMLNGGFILVDSLAIGITDSSVIQALIFFGTIGLAADLLSTPFDVYDTFVIEQRFGFNKTTWKVYIADKLKSWLLAAVIGGGLLSLIVWMYALLGADFWWLAWLTITVFSLLMSLFYSNLIVPLFNKQTPLEEGELRTALENLAGRTGFGLKDIYIIDGSKRSTRANAYFTGLGRMKRIVLYDTLLQKHTTAQIVSVLAHEIGHYRKKHTLKTLILSVIQTGIVLYLFSLVVGSPVIYEALGSSHHSFHLGLVVFLILYSPVSTITSIGLNYMSRRFEFQADRFAAENADAGEMVASLRMLTADNMSDLTPHPAYVFVNYSHPPLRERIESIQRFAGSQVKQG